MARPTNAVPLAIRECEPIVQGATDIAQPGRWEIAIDDHEMLVVPPSLVGDTPPGLKSGGFWANPSNEELRAQGPVPTP
jgi:hypothetical protein